MDFARRAQSQGRCRWGLLVGPQGVGLSRMARELRLALPEQVPGLGGVFIATDIAETHTPFSLLRRVAAAMGSTRACWGRATARRRRGWRGCSGRWPRRGAASRSSWSSTTWTAPTRPRW